MRRDFKVRDTPEFLQIVCDQAEAVLAVDAGIEKRLAVEIGQKIAMRIAGVLAGSRVYISAGTWNGRARPCFELSRRDMEIYCSFTGNNHRDLAALFGVSPLTIRLVLSRVQFLLRSGVISQRLIAPSTPPPTTPARPADASDLTV